MEPKKPTNSILDMPSERSIDYRNIKNKPVAGKENSIDYSKLKTPTDNTPQWKKNMASKQRSEHIDFHTKMNGMGKSEDLVTEAEKPATQASTDVKPVEWSKEPVTIEGGVEKRNIKNTADKLSKMTQAYRAALGKKANSEGAKADGAELEKAGAFRRKPALRPESSLNKWKRKLTEGPMMKSSYNDQVNQKAKEIKGAHKEPKAPSMDERVAAIKNKYTGLHKSDQLTKDVPNLDPAGVASLAHAFGKSDGGALDKWKNKRMKKAMGAPAMPAAPKAPKMGAPAVKTVGPQPMQKGNKDMEKSKDLNKATGHEKGVNTPIGGSPNSGVSKAGHQVNIGADRKAKQTHAKVLGEMKSMKKPDLGKSDWKVEGEVPMEKSYDLHKACHGHMQKMMKCMRGGELDKSDDSQDMASVQLTEIVHHLNEIRDAGHLDQLPDWAKAKLTLANDYLSCLSHLLLATPDLHGAVSDLMNNGPAQAQDDSGMEKSVVKKAPQAPFGLA